MTRTPTRARKRRLRYVAAALGVGVLASAVVLEVGLRVATRATPSGNPRIGPLALLPYRPSAESIETWWNSTRQAVLNVPDPELGWTIGKAAYTRHDPYFSNPQGARALPHRVYPPEPPADRIRIVAVGDSFTFGSKVTLESSWPFLLEERNPRLEVINLGVPGHGTDQAYLRWVRDGKPLKPHVAMLSIYPDHVFRNLTQINYFSAPLGGYQSKPRFILEDGSLTLIENPGHDLATLTRLVRDPIDAPELAHDYWLRASEVKPSPLYSLHTFRVLASVRHRLSRRDERRGLLAGADESAMDLMAAIANAFIADARRAGVTPVIVMMPKGALLADYPGEDTYPLVRHLQKRGIEVVDLMPAFARHAEREGIENLFLGGIGHFTPRGNELVVIELMERLPRYLP